MTDSEIDPAILKIKGLMESDTFTRCPKCEGPLTAQWGFMDGRGVIEMVCVSCVPNGEVADDWEIRPASELE